MPNIYQFTVNDAHGSPKSLEDYRGKVLLVVNTASRCGLTPQYKELQTLYAKYREQGFEILDFPCNQFREQAPENTVEYMRNCKTKFGTEFTIFAKIDVNGSDTHPLYVYLKQQKPEDQGDKKFKDLLLKLASLGEERGEHDLKWNFTKFLINRDGVVVARYAPSTTPFELEDEIKALLA